MNSSRATADDHGVSATFQDAVTLHAQGRLDEAVAAYRDVLSQGRHFGAAYNLSLLYAASGQYTEALALALEAVKLGPGSAEAHDHLGGILVRLGKHSLALTQFEEALRIQPTFARCCNNLGAALQALGRVDESIAWFERALDLDPNYTDARANLSNALALLDRFDEAQAQLSRIASDAPDDPVAYDRIGSIASTEGRLDDAVAAYEQALERNPRSGKLYYALATVKPLALDDPHVAGMMRLLEQIATLPLDEQTALHFALGEVSTKNGRHAQALVHFKAGNALKRRHVDYDEPGTLAAFANIAAAFGKGALQSLAGSGFPSAKPVFIVGMPRSGTTLVEQILASHSQVHGAGELETFGKIVGELLLPEAMRLTPELLQSIGSRYVESISELSPSAQRITDKMPSNFRFVGLIHLALPNAKIIHTRRNAVDACVSCFAQNFGGEQPFAYDLAELGRYYRAYERLMNHWRAVLPPGAMLEVEYETVVDDFEAQARRLIEYVGLEWEPACLEFHKTQRSVRTASVAQVRQPIYRSSIGRWEAHADALRPLLDALSS
jgi:tetratricopeptide (TPR) repeat protein